MVLPVLSAKLNGIPIIVMAQSIALRSAIASPILPQKSKSDLKNLPCQIHQVPLLVQMEITPKPANIKALNPNGIQ